MDEPGCPGWAELWLDASGIALPGQAAGAAAMTLPDALPAPYDRRPDARGVRPQPETVSLVTGQIDALLARTPSFYALTPQSRRRCAATSRTSLPTPPNSPAMPGPRPRSWARRRWSARRSPIAPIPRGSRSLAPPRRRPTCRPRPPAGSPTSPSRRCAPSPSRPSSPTSSTAPSTPSSAARSSRCRRSWIW